MPARDGARVTFDTLECRWMISALQTAIETLRARADNPATEPTKAFEAEQAHIRLDMFCDELIELTEAAHREATQNFIEDLSQKKREENP